jgi:hypothetical protein
MSAEPVEARDMALRHDQGALPVAKGGWALLTANVDDVAGQVRQQHIQGLPGDLL